MPTKEQIDEALGWMDSQNPTGYEICEAAIRLAKGYRAEKARADLLERQGQELLAHIQEMCKPQFPDAEHGPWFMSLATEELLGRHVTERAALGRDV